MLIGSDRSEMASAFSAELMGNIRRKKMLAWGASAGLHGGCLLAAAWLHFLTPDSSNVLTTVHALPGGTDPVPESVVETGLPGTARPAAQSAAGIEPAGGVTRSLEEIADADAPETRAMLQRILDQSIRNAQAASAEQQLARLETLAGELQGLATERSVNEIAGFLGAVLETTPAPTSADGPVGKFDPETAQIVDVRQETREGKVRHIALLKDARGMTSEVEVDADTGESLARTFALMRKFPLLESVYRKSVMPVLDRMLKDQKPAMLAPRSDR